jgi:hypothetical protein
MVAKEVNRVSGRVRHALDQPVVLVKDHPLPSMLLCFGIGLGVGVVLAQACSGSLMHFAHHEPTTTERISRQVYEALSHVLPQTFTSRLHS